MLHLFIIKNVVDSAPSLYARDVKIVFGIEAYSYPPLFHALMKVMNVTSEVYAIFVSCILGTLSTFFYNLFFKEIGRSDELATVSSFLLSFTPSFLYRSSCFIPENLGLLFFSITLFLLARKRYLYALIPIVLWALTHRGWSILLVIALIYFISTRKRKAVAIVTGVVGAGIFMYTFEIAKRLYTIPATAAGYVKWIGPVQIALLSLALYDFLKS